MRNKLLLICCGSLIISIIISSLIYTWNNNRINKYEDTLKETYSEVVYINNRQFIVSDKKGNIHLISMSGKNQMILSLQDIESGLDREFTLKDIQKPDLHLNRK